MKVNSYITGLRTFDLKKMLWNIAASCNVDINFTDESGLLWRTYYFEVEGSLDDLSLFNTKVKQFINQWNDESEDEFYIKEYFGKIKKRINEIPKIKKYKQWWKWTKTSFYLSYRQKIRKIKHFIKNPQRNAHIKSLAVKEGTITIDKKSYQYWVVPAPVFVGGYNGYVVFPKRPVKERGYDGILSYVPVHGGITYANNDKLGMVYGFDVLHYNSDDIPKNDMKWTKKQCKIMIKGILVSSKVEKAYRKGKSNEEKTEYIQKVADVNHTNDIGFGAMINLLSGEL